MAARSAMLLTPGKAGLQSALSAMLVEFTQAVAGAVEQGDIGTDADRDAGRIGADHAATQDDHFSGRHSRHAGQQDAAPAMFISSACMPACTERRPAICDIGASNARPAASSTVSNATALTPRCISSAPAPVQRPDADHQRPLPGVQQRHFGGLRLLTLKISSAA